MSADLREENRSLREALGQRYEYPNIVAHSAKMQEVLALVERVAPTNSTVLLGGESGVGKDLIARVIHQHSQRASGPFIKINSTAIPENLLESELFGYEKGAFTGATDQQARQIRAGRQGHAVSRRNRRRAAGDASEAACASCRSANSSGWAARAPLKVDVRLGRRHQSRSARRARRRTRFARICTIG